MLWLGRQPSPGSVKWVVIYFVRPAKFWKLDFSNSQTILKQNVLTWCHFISCQLHFHIFHQFTVKKSVCFWTLTATLNQIQSCYEYQLVLHCLAASSKLRKLILKIFFNACIMFNYVKIVWSIGWPPLLSWHHTILHWVYEIYKGMLKSCHSV